MKGRVARECDGPDRPDTGCPVQVGRMASDDHPGDQESPIERVAWAGLPINLDFAFSQAQRDKVYVQHLTRQRWRALRRTVARERDAAAAYQPVDAEAG